MVGAKRHLYSLLVAITYVHQCVWSMWQQGHRRVAWRLHPDHLRAYKIESEEVRNLAKRNLWGRLLCSARLESSLGFHSRYLKFKLLLHSKHTQNQT